MAKIIEKIILFDGKCKFCGISIRFIRSHDKHNQFQYLSLQSDEARHLLQLHKLPLSSPVPMSVYFITHNTAYGKSTAVLEILWNLKGFWRLFIIFYIIPRFIRDWLYDFVAVHRYRWYGADNSCAIN